MGRKGKIGVQGEEGNYVTVYIGYGLLSNPDPCKMGDIKIPFYGLSANFYSAFCFHTYGAEVPLMPRLKN